MNKKTIILAVACAFIAGCVPIYPYHAISSHTIQVADKQEADVVWVGDYRDGSLQRCHNSPTGPTCVKIK